MDYVNVVEDDLALQPIVYISGKIRSDSTEGMLKNVAAAERLALRFIKAGFPVILVHSQARVWYDLSNEEDLHNLFIAGDQALVARCDVIAFVKGWQESEGARREHETALACGVKCLYTKDDINDYLKRNGAWPKKRATAVT